MKTDKTQEKVPELLPLSTRLARCVIAMLATLYLPVILPLFSFLDIALNVEKKDRLTWKELFAWWSSWLLMKK